MVLRICYLRNDGVVFDVRFSNLGLESSLIFLLDFPSIHQLDLEREDVPMLNVDPSYLPIADLFLVDHGIGRGVLSVYPSLLMFWRD